ncbi:MAG: Y-family DNA polymerase [Dehalococcoidia bacterium]
MLSMQQNNSRFALIDCNNFYVSCERAFNPMLNNRPVVVLSNNDGCIISRSEEIKKLGVPMGAPVFKWQRLLDLHHAVTFSSNFALYGDISNRIMSLINYECDDMEVYSIDEAFVQFHNDANFNADRLQASILQSTSIPVSIGVGQTKTLAKIANYVAKKFPKHQGVFDISAVSNIDEVLASIPINNVWGIGKRTSKLLNRYGVTNSRQLRDLSDVWVRNNLNVNCLRTIQELRGINCLQLETSVPRKKSIATTRSFGMPIEKLSTLEESISTYAVRTTEKLRQQRSLASGLIVFLRTNQFADGEQYHNMKSYIFDEPTDYTPVVIQTAVACMRYLYRQGYEYKKAGVILFGITNNAHRQANMFLKTDHQYQQRVSATIDKINRKLGKDTIFFGKMGLKRDWRIFNNRMSKFYTTSTYDLLRVRA